MSAPVFAHGKLRLYLLGLLEERPMHGYDLMQALSARFGGTYTPSAGTIYPRLAKLEEDGLVTRTVDGRKTVYAITPAGTIELDARRDELGGLEEELTDSVRRLADEVRGSVRDAMRTLRADLAAARASDVPERPAEPHQADARAEHHVDVRGLVRDAEAAITEFRAELRGELRRALAEDRLERAAVDELRTGLESLAARIRSALRP